MGFADTGKLGVAVRPRVYSDRLPKNVAQPGLEGKKLFQIGGVNPTIFNLDAALHAKITQSEYFKCLYVFKTFDKIVDLIYEKVSYVEPFTHRGASTKRSLQKQPSSAFCLLLKLFHLRLTEDQVRELLDHPDSTYLRVMGMLYVRYGTPAPGVAILSFDIIFHTYRRRPVGLLEVARRVLRRPRGVLPGHPADAHDDGRRLRAAAAYGVRVGPVRNALAARRADLGVPVLRAPRGARRRRKACSGEQAEAPLGGRGVGLSLLRAGLLRRRRRRGGRDRLARRRGH